MPHHVPISFTISRVNISSLSMTECSKAQIIANKNICLLSKTNDLKKNILTKYIVALSSRGSLAQWILIFNYYITNLLK